MTVDIGDVIGTGFRYTFSRNGLLLLVATYILAMVNAVMLPILGGEQVATGPTPEVPVPAFAAALILLVSFLASLFIGIGAVRTFVADRTDGFPPGAFTRNAGWALLNLVVGIVIFSIALVIGFILLVIPGLFLLVSLYFWGFYVIVEDQNFVEGFQNSFSLTAGHRLRLFGLGIVVVLIVMVVNVVFSIPEFALGGFAGTAIYQVSQAFVSVFFAATGARAFTQLRETSDGAEPDVEDPETADADDLL